MSYSKKKSFLFSILIFVLVMSGCGEGSYLSSSVGDTAYPFVSGSSVSGTAASGDAVSGKAVSGVSISESIADEDRYEITAPLEEELHWLSSNQKAWCNEAIQPDKYTNTLYSVTDLDHDGQIEIAQVIDQNYAHYQEVQSEGDTFCLSEAGSFEMEEYNLGILCDEDEAGNRTEAFTRDEHPNALLPSGIRPRSEAAWAMASVITPDVFGADYVRNKGDKHISSVITEDIYFESGLALSITGKVMEDVLYDALSQSLSFFLSVERISARIRKELMAIYQSDDYTKAVDDHGWILVTDDPDGHPRLIRVPKPDSTGTDHYREDMLAVEAAPGDSSCVGLAYMRYSVWKVYLSDVDMIPKNSIAFGITMMGNACLNHYFPAITQQ